MNIKLLFFLFIPVITGILHAKSDNKKAQLIDKLSKVMLQEDVVEKQQTQLIDQIKNQISLSNQNLLRQLRYSIDSHPLQTDFTSEFNQLSKAMQEDFDKQIRKSFDLKDFLKELNQKVYGKHFSQSELVAMGRFFSSKAGRKYLKMGPEVMKEVTQKTQQDFSKAVNQVATTLGDKYMTRFKELRDRYEVMEKNEKSRR